MDDNNQIIIYQSEDGDTRIEVKFTGETVWLSQQQMADKFFMLVHNKLHLLNKWKR